MVSALCVWGTLLIDTLLKREFLIRIMVNSFDVIYKLHGNIWCMIGLSGDKLVLLNVTNDQTMYLTHS